MNSSTDILKTLWASGILDYKIIMATMEITEKEYLDLLNTVAIENVNDGKLVSWARYLAQVQHRYIQLEEVKSKSRSGSKTELECVQAAISLDSSVLALADNLGILDRLRKPIKTNKQVELSIGAAKSFLQEGENNGD